MIKLLLTAVGLVGLLLQSLPLSAQTQQLAYPERSIRLVIPYPPGGSNDNIARLLATQLQKQLGQSIVIENRAGASGTIGSEIVAKAPADGYTLLFNASSQVFMPLVVAKPPYDTLKDFTHITRVGHVPLLVVINPQIPANNLKEFIELVRAQPGQYNWGTSGFGTSSHLAEAAIVHALKLEMQIIGYKGATPQLTDVMGGHIAAAVSPMPGVFSHVQHGKLKAIATTNQTRLSQLPNVPTVAESGIPGFELLSWYGIWGPAGLPGGIVEKLSCEITTALNAEELKPRFKELSFEPSPLTPEDFETYIKSEIQQIGKMVKDANIVITF